MCIIYETYFIRCAWRSFTTLSMDWKLAACIIILHPDFLPVFAQGVYLLCLCALDVHNKGVQLSIVHHPSHCQAFHSVSSLTNQMSYSAYI